MNSPLVSHLILRIFETLLAAKKLLVLYKSLLVNLILRILGFSLFFEPSQFFSLVFSYPPICLHILCIFPQEMPNFWASV